MYLQLLTRHAWRFGIQDGMTNIEISFEPAAGGKLSIELTHQQCQLLATMIGATDVHLITMVAENATIRIAKTTPEDDNSMDRILILEQLPEHKTEKPADPVRVPISASDSFCLASALRLGAHEGEMNEEAIGEQEDDALENLQADDVDDVDDLDDTTLAELMGGPQPSRRRRQYNEDDDV